MRIRLPPPPDPNLLGSGPRVRLSAEEIFVERLPG